ncbi:MAG: hypothetical protein E7452_06910 [Ruminococcaceae bacterium]|nr:hypothetical protein [Oscillospiraceae bacterium]
MLGVVLAALGVILVFVGIYKNKELREQENKKPASVSSIMHFLHAYQGLCRTHSISDSGANIEWYRNDIGYLIRIETTIYQIDHEDASVTIEALRDRIKLAGQVAEQGIRNAEAAYNANAEARNRELLNFFGINSMQGCFWDIDDCEYVDGRYLYFKAESVVFSQLQQGLRESLDEIKARVTELYENVKVEENRTCIVIRFL